MIPQSLWLDAGCRVGILYRSLLLQPVEVDEHEKRVKFPKTARAEGRLSSSFPCLWLDYRRDSRARQAAGTRESKSFRDAHCGNQNSVTTDSELGNP